MKKNLSIIIGIVLLGSSLLFYRFGPFDEWLRGAVGSGASEEAIAEISSYAYTEEYVHPGYRFSFRHPDNFTVVAVPEENGEAILVQDTDKRVGVQIVVSSFAAGEIDITKELLRQELPGTRIKDAEEFPVGTRKGLAFLSDNEAFGGASREVWFVYQGNLYQISTYAELDEFLTGLFATWKFE